MRALAASLLLLALAHHPAAADTPPWSVGITDQQKADSRVLLDAGNALFLEKKYPEALEKYKAAVAAWDHPAIRFNIVRVLVLLDRPVEAAENLELALEYGAAPLEDKVYTDALAYQKLLAMQIADLAIDCKQGGVAISLDGKPLGTCPLTRDVRVAPGRHLVVGTKAGMMPRTVDVTAIGGTAGKPQPVDVTLDKLEHAGKVVHRWPGYVPWLVFAGGFVIGGAGGLLLSSASSQLDSYDLIVGQRCTTHTCTAADLADVAHLKSNARFENALGGSLVVTGAAAILSGAAMLYLNRGRTVYTEGPVVAPTADGTGATASFVGTF